MIKVEYLDTVLRFGIWTWNQKEKYDDLDPVNGILYKAEGWAQRKSDELNTGDNIYPFIVRRVWVERVRVSKK